MPSPPPSSPTSAPLVLISLSPAFVVSLTVELHGLCMASPAHRAEAISGDHILLISSSFTLLTHLQPGLCS